MGGWGGVGAAIGPPPPEKRPAGGAIGERALRATTSVAPVVNSTCCWVRARFGRERAPAPSPGFSCTGGVNLRARRAPALAFSRACACLSTSE